MHNKMTDKTIQKSNKEYPPAKGSGMKHLRMGIDLAMTALIPLLMAYSLIGESFHEIAGSLMFLLFIVHHLINRRWWIGLFKGKYSPARVFRTVVNFLLLVFMFLQPVSGILISKHLYTFVRVGQLTARAREIHLAGAYWGLMLMCIHAGIHLRVPMTRLGKRKSRLAAVIRDAAAVISIWGIHVFLKRNLAAYMFLQQKFAFIDPSQSKLVFFIEYLAMMILFATLGCTIDLMLTHKKPVHPGAEKEMGVKK